MYMVKTLTQCNRIPRTKSQKTGRNRGGRESLINRSPTISPVPRNFEDFVSRLWLKKKSEAIDTKNSVSTVPISSLIWFYYYQLNNKDLDLSVIVRFIIIIFLSPWPICKVKFQHYMKSIMLSLFVFVHLARKVCTQSLNFILDLTLECTIWV